MSLIEFEQNSASAAQRACQSHDGLAAKFAKVLLAASRLPTIEAVASETHFSTDTVRRIVEKYKEIGDPLFEPRPKKEPTPLFCNFLLSTYEGAEWAYYKGALSHSGRLANQLVLEEVKSKLGDPSIKKILELGPGEGALSMMLNDAGYQVECIDIDDYLLVSPDLSFKSANIDGKLLESAGNSVQYDAIVAVEVLEHLHYPWKLIEDAFRILKPGGYLIVTTPNITSFVSRAYFLTGGYFYLFSPPPREKDFYGHISPLPWWVIEHVCYSTGFENVKTTEFQKMSIICLQGWRFALRSLIRIVTFVFSIWSKDCPVFGKSIMVCARKPL